MEKKMSPLGWFQTMGLVLWWCSCFKSAKSASSSNIALNREAWQSSDGHWGAPASLAFDGNTNPDYSAGTTTHTDQDDNPYIAVDLTRSYYVSHLLVTNTFSTPSRLADFIIVVGDTRPSASAHPATDPSFTECYRNSGYPAGGETVTVTCDPGPVPGRYVSLYLARQDWLVVTEIQIFGTAATTEAPTTTAQSESTAIETTKSHSTTSQAHTTTDQTPPTTSSALEEEQAGSLYLYNGNPYCSSVTSSLREIVNLNSCITFKANSNSVISGVISLDIPRPSFRYSLTGIGIECSPIRGLLVSARSASGSIYVCKAYTGDENSNLVRCRYRCICPDGCSDVIIQSFDNTATQSLCKASIY